MKRTFPKESIAINLASKLKTARLAAGLSTRAVADKLVNRFSISHATIANYEKGKTAPSLDVLATIAELYGRDLHWFLESGPMLTGARYRKLVSKVRVNDRRWFEANAQRWLEAYTKLERWLGTDAKLSRSAPTLNAGPDVTGQALAKKVRKQLGLDDDQPVHSVVQLLEKYGVRVIEMATDLRIDGLAARFGDEFVVILNPKTSNDRTRMSAGHELKHILAGDCDDGASNDEASGEDMAYDFASHLILPQSQLVEAFKGQSMVKLVSFKERFGISLAGMVFRAEHSQIITKAQARWMWMQFAQRGWRTNEPGVVRADRATRFEQLLDGALAQLRLTWSKAASLMGVREHELHERYRLALGDKAIQEKGEELPEDQVLKFPR